MENAVRLRLILGDRLEIYTTLKFIGKGCKLIAPLEIHLRGVAAAANNKLIIQLIQRNVENVLNDRVAEYQEHGERSDAEIDWTDVLMEIE